MHDACLDYNCFITCNKF